MDQLAIDKIKSLLNDEILFNSITTNVFTFFDEDKSGFLSPEEVLYLTNDQKQLTKADISAAAKEFDVNRDGKLSRTEFTKLFRKLLTGMISPTEQKIQNNHNKSPHKSSPKKVIRNQQKKNINFKVLLLGLDSSGKTTMHHKLSNSVNYQPEPTINVSSCDVEYDELVQNLIDVGGKINYRNQWELLANDADVIIWVIDSIDKNRIHDLKIELNNIKRGCPMLFCLNKADYTRRLNKDDVIKQLGLNDIKNYWEMIETIARDQDVNEVTDFIYKIFKISQVNNTYINNDRKSNSKIIQLEKLLSQHQQQYDQISKNLLDSSNKNKVLTKEKESISQDNRILRAESSNLESKINQYKLSIESYESLSTPSSTPVKISGSPSLLSNKEAMKYKKLQEDMKIKYNTTRTKLSEEQVNSMIYSKQVEELSEKICNINFNSKIDRKLSTEDFN